MRAPLALDTAPEIERRQIEAWRRMAPADKAATVTGLSRAAWALAAAGVRHRHPGASEREQRLRLALLLLDPDLVVAAYPDAAPLLRP
jgi:hypothetical protein